ncbi:hypothetical protein TPB0596_46450 [Tsukamurella pulmonis]|uniref:hypothetical protein n=1 Tax=Tsukamurella pulmonis TaxID=47312 RepID=UPI001EDDD796|nr:hypothetical protein [Tsukamurella pulmonis]BDD84882.1 hypothetical protein TPB0596_46450 [Tsukamurella pulmonis]
MTQIESTAADLNRAAGLIRAQILGDEQSYATIAAEAQNLERLPHMVGPLAYLAGQFITETAEASTAPSVAGAVEWLDRISSVMLAAELDGTGGDQ